jgi:hypothetical protein
MAWPAPQKYAASQCSLLTLSEASSTLHLDTFHRATDASIFTSFQRLKFENVKIFIEETLIWPFTLWHCSIRSFCWDLPIFFI